MKTKISIFLITFGLSCITLADGGPETLKECKEFTNLTGSFFVMRDYCDLHMKDEYENYAKSQNRKCIKKYGEKKMTDSVMSGYLNTKKLIDKGGLEAYCKHAKEAHGELMKP